MAETLPATNSESVPSTEIEINDQFKKCIDLLEGGRQHLFITGKAGTGKSTFLTYFRNHTKKRMAVLAPTGVAAVNIEGETIHSFFKFQPNVTLSEAKDIAKNRRGNRLYQELDLMVIDEISMVRADLLDCVDVFLKTVRDESTPFGGIQMAFIGDLYQLPPVVTGEERVVLKNHYPSPYFFDAQVIQSLFPPDEEPRLELVELEKIYRQQDDRFIDLLNSIRNKTMTDDQVALLNERYRENLETMDGDSIYLTATNKQADELNKANLEKLTSRRSRFQGTIEGEFDSKSLPTEPDLVLKKNARIMLLNNDSLGRWINGTLGTILKMKKDEMSVRLDSGETVEVLPFTWSHYRSRYNESSQAIEKDEIGRFTQFPVRLAWAITIHKSQGKTFDNVIIDIGKGAFSFGQIYVALSRCRRFEGILLKTPIKKEHIWVDYRVIRFLTNFQYQLSKTKMSLEERVEIITAAIEGGRKLTITYLKAGDEKSTRVILPAKIGPMEYQGYAFLGIEAYCFTQKGRRVFNVDRILAIAEADE